MSERPKENLSDMDRAEILEDIKKELDEYIKIHIAFMLLASGDFDHSASG